MGSKRLWWVVLAGVVYTTSAFGQSPGTSVMQMGPAAKRPYGFEGEWKFLLGGGNAQEGKDTWSAAYLWFSANLKFKLAPDLKANISPMIRTYGGRAQERYDDDSLNNRFGVYDAHISYSPFEALELKGGALTQYSLSTPMLVSGLRSFAGFQEILKARVGEVEGRLVFQQVIPGSSSMNTEREKQEALPWFRTEHLELKGLHGGQVEWKALGGYYEWKDIPSKIAYESWRQGNAAFGTPLPGNTQLAYSHQGLFGGGELLFNAFDGLALVGEYSRVHNVTAPSNAADAQMFGGGPRIRWKNRTLDIRYRSYFIESDATIAAYNKSRLGNTNRIGTNLEVNLHFADYGFTLYGEMYRARPINTADVQQRDLDQYYFGVETDYASF